MGSKQAEQFQSIPQTTAPLMSVGVISATALAYEVLLTRIFAIVHWHHLVAIAISLALLGYGASGTFMVLAGDVLRRRLPAAFVGNALLFSVSTVLCVMLAQEITFDPQAVAWQPDEIVRLAGSFLLLAIPFFAAANCIGLVLWHFEQQIPRIYGVDLFGAGLGALGLLWGLSLWRPDALLIGVMGGGLIATVLGAITLHWHVRTSLLAALGLMLGTMLLARPDVAPAVYKDLSRALSVYGAKLDTEISGVAGTVSVVRNEQVPTRTAPGMSLQATALPPHQLQVFVDGDIAGTLADFSASADSTAYLSTLLSALPYALRPALPRVAVLGAGTGLRVQQALVQGVERVSAIEPNPELVDVTCNTYRALQPDVCAQPAVRWHVQSPRAFMATSVQTFDLITLALHADTAGLDALAVDYSASRQAMVSYLRRLADNGILVMEGPTRVPPRLSLRVLNTARAALQSTGADAPAEHLVMLRGWQRFILLVAKAPIDNAERNAIRQFSRSLGFDLVWLPGMQPNEANRYQQLASAVFHQGASRLLNAGDRTASRFRLQVIDDDRPYPDLSTRWGEVRSALLHGDADARSRLDTGLLLALATLALVTLAAVVLIIAPLAVLLRHEGRPPGGLRVRTLIYFLLIGIAFLFTEIAWIQRLQLFLGHPVYATTAVLAAFLVFAGAGSLWSQGRSPQSAGRRLTTTVIVIAASALLYLYLLPDWLAQVAGQATWVRIGLVTLLLAPLAFAMGIPFPLALQTLGERAPSLVPWAWGINGSASVIAAAAAPLIGSEIGFSGLTITAAGSYLALPLIGLVHRR